jgi:hypothetical protein
MLCGVGYFFRGGTNGTLKGFDTITSLNLGLLTNGAQVIFTSYYQNIQMVATQLTTKAKEW